MSIIKNVTTEIIMGEDIHGNCKAVYCITNGKYFPSQKEAAKEANVAPSNISNCCRGHLHTINRKKYCFVTDMPLHLIEISNAMHNLQNKANAYDRIKELIK